MEKERERRKPFFSLTVTVLWCVQLYRVYTVYSGYIFHPKALSLKPKKRERDSYGYTAVEARKEGGLGEKE